MSDSSQPEMTVWKDSFTAKGSQSVLDVLIVEGYYIYTKGKYTG